MNSPCLAGCLFGRALRAVPSLHFVPRLKQRTGKRIDNNQTSMVCRFLPRDVIAWALILKEECGMHLLKKRENLHFSRQIYKLYSRHDPCRKSIYRQKYTAILTKCMGASRMYLKKPLPRKQANGQSKFLAIGGNRCT